MLDMTNYPEALSSARYDFPVAKTPLFTKSLDGDMMMVPPERGVAVIREDTSEVLATVGKDYEIIPHGAVMDSVTEAILSSEIDTTGVKVNDGLYENGARARRSIILPKHSVNPMVGDVMHMKIDVFNSLDGRWAFRTEFGYYRLVCKNGMVRPDFNAGIYAKHTSGLTVEAIGKRLEAALGLLAKDEEEFVRWTKVGVSETAASWFFKRTLCRIKRRGMKDDVNKTLHQRLLTRFAAETPTVYGLWNAMTAWSTHDPVPRGAAHNVLLNRENAVATALRSKAFDDIAHGREIEDAEIVA